MLKNYVIQPAVFPIIYNEQTKETIISVYRCGSGYVEDIGNNDEFSDWKPFTNNTNFDGYTVYQVVRDPWERWFSWFHYFLYADSVIDLDLKTAKEFIQEFKQDFYYDPHIAFQSSMYRLTCNFHNIKNPKCLDMMDINKVIHKNDAKQHIRTDLSNQILVMNPIVKLFLKKSIRRIYYADYQWIRYCRLNDKFFKVNS